MSLNNIQLNPFDLAALYRNSLVQTNEATQIKISSPPSQKSKSKTLDAAVNDEADPDSSPREWKYLGENKKNILLIVRYSEAPYLPDQQLNFLISILGACKLSLADIAVLNLTNSPTNSYHGVFHQFKCRTIVLFGITPTEFGMPVSFPEFQVQPFNNCTFLHAPVLEKLEADKVLKSKLWVCLRKIFGV